MKGPAAQHDVCGNLNRAGIRRSHDWQRTLSIVQDQIGQHFCPHGEFSVVVDQSHSSEFVHEVRDARPRRAYHFGEDFVTHRGYGCVRNDRWFAQARQLQKNPGQPLLAMIKELIAEVCLQVDIAF